MLKNALRQRDQVLPAAARSTLALEELGVAREDVEHCRFFAVDLARQRLQLGELCCPFTVGGHRHTHYQNLADRCQ